MLLMKKGLVGERERECCADTVVAVDIDRNSQWAVKWAVDNLLKKNPNCILVHVMHPDDTDFVPKEGRSPTKAETEEIFLPFHGFCTRTGIVTKEVILCDVDVPNALIDYVTANSISRLVVGASTRSAILRKLSASDIGKCLLKSAPETCSTYIVGKDKLQMVRYAKNAPRSTSAAVSSPTSSLGTPKKIYPFGIRPPSFQTTAPDTYDVVRSLSSLGSRMSMGSDNNSCSEKSSDFITYSWKKTESPLKPSESYVSKSSFSSSTSDVSDFSVPLSFRSNNMASIVTSSESGHSIPSFTSHVPGNVEDELEKLQLEFKESLSVYNMACQDVAAAEEKARMKILQLRTSEEDKAPRKNLWSNLTDIEEIKKSSTMTPKETVPETEEEEEETEEQRRFISSSALNKNAKKGAGKQDLNTLYKINACYRRYTIEEIEEATEYFSSSFMIGEGGYGPVYKATLDHTPVAIKVLRSNVSQGLRQFHQEVELLSCMRHPNMVILVGACPEYGCLVYEYMDNGNLEDRLLCKDGTPSIPWPARFKIAAEIATGLVFLHQTRPEPVVHRDIKPSNILLDRNYMTKIGDVGLARLVPNKTTQCRMTTAAGTFCYIDPEYQQTGMLGVKSDVYSFGVVLLQIITGKPPMGLTMQVEKTIENGTFLTILDQSIPGWPVEAALSVARLALKCCELERKDRPDLSSDVLPELIRLKNLGLEIGAEMTVQSNAIQEQEPEPGHQEIEMGPQPSEINNVGRGRWHRRLRSMTGGWNMKSSFKKPQIFSCTSNNKKQQEKEQQRHNLVGQDQQVLVEGCWSFVSCSKLQSPQELQKFNSFS